jgi:hypothetical protein
VVSAAGFLACGPSLVAFVPLAGNAAAPTPPRHSNHDLAVGRVADRIRADVTEGIDDHAER